MNLWGSFGAMRSCIFLSMDDASSDSIHISPVLVSTALIEVGWQGSFSTHMFTPALWCGWDMPIGFVLFYKVYYKHLGLSAKTWGLRSILGGSPFNFFCLALSGGVSEFVGKFSLVFPARYGFLVPPNIFGSLRSCRRFFQSYGRSFCGAPVGSILATWSVSPFHGSPLTKGLQHFRRNRFTPARDLPVSLHLDFCFPSIMKERFLAGWFPSLWKGF